MSYKMVCIDMDGTLLNKEKKVPEESRNIIREVNKKGVKVIITTGRLYNDAAYYSELVGASDGVIAGNGAVIKEKTSDKIIFRSKIDKEVCKRLLKAAKKCGVILHLHTIDQIISNSYFSNIVAKAMFMGRPFKEFSINIKTVKGKNNWEKLLEEYEGKVTKCIMFTPFPSRTEEFKKELEMIPEITFYPSGKRSVEINEKGISKGRAVKKLSEHYSIDREDIICIGDNDNDISMIEYAGLGISMGNGIDALKEKANYITDTNEHDGVGKALEKFILNK